MAQFDTNSVLTHFRLLFLDYLAYPPTGPYQFPTNGKQPVILGANGMPVASASKPEAGPPMPSPQAALPPATGYPQGIENGSTGMPSQSFDYGGDQGDSRS